MKQKILYRAFAILLQIAIINSFIFVFPQKTNAQNANLDFKSLFSDAEYFFLYHDYHEALPLFLAALDKSPDNANVQYKVAFCYLNIAGAKHRAIPYLLKASENISTSYQEGSYKEQGAPKEVLFYLGEAYRIDEQLDEAIQYYNQFLEQQNSKETPINPEFVQQQIDACTRAKEMMRHKLYVKEEVLPIFDDNSYLLTPAMSTDGKTIVFTRQEKFYDAIYTATRKNSGEWNNPKNITLDLAVEGNVYSTSINHNGTQIFLYMHDKDVGNIFTSVKTDGKWGKAERLGKSINTRNWESFASISPDGETLYFSSNRSGGHGGFDIYYSKLQQDGTWGSAINIGENINTPFNEEAPYLTPDGNTLFFISQGHNSMGGYDVFFSDRIDDDQWSTPVNVGYPVNTTDDEMMYFPLSKNEALVTYVEKGQPSIRKIRTIAFSNDPDFISVPLIGSVMLSDNSDITPNLVKVEIVDKNTSRAMGPLYAQEQTGEFSAKLLPGTYNVKVNAAGYLPHEQEITIADGAENSPMQISLERQVLAPRQFTVGAILFDFDKFNVKADAQQELDKLANFLNQYAHITLEVCGHTDSKGSREYNKKLSLRRANSVMDYLIKRGVDKGRLKVEGADFSQKIAINSFANGKDCPEGRRLNRRVTLRVLESDIPIEIFSEIHVPEHLKPNK